MTLTIIHAGAVGAVLCAPRRWLTEDRHVTKFVEACLSIDNSCTLGSFMLVIIAFLAKSESSVLLRLRGLRGARGKYCALV
jgi:hypothetical protein